MKFGQIITCDICGADMTASGNYQMSEDKKKEDGDVIMIKSICCPACGAKYPYIVTNKEIRKLIRKRSEYIGRICKMMETKGLKATDPKIKKMLEENKHMGREIDAKVSALTHKYLGGEKHGEE